MTLNHETREKSRPRRHFMNGQWCSTIFGSDDDSENEALASGSDGPDQPTFAPTTAFLQLAAVTIRRVAPVISRRKAK